MTSLLRAFARFLAVLLAVLAISACGGNADGGGTPSPTPAATGGPANNTEAQCLDALRKLYKEGANGSTATPSAPPACIGLDEATLNRLIGQVLDEALGNVFSESPSPS